MTRDFLIGRQLANFRIDRFVGGGGMAQVYYGWDVKLARPVAVKVIDARYRGNPAYAERFVREARTVATWRHDSIVQVYYADEEDDLYYFVMEYIDGVSLADRLAEYTAQRRLIPHAEVLRIGRRVASALDYAHQRGVIHRDVKPANVMLASDGRVLLTDFGLALDLHQGSVGEVFGTAHYIAPEQARRSSQAVPQSDLYSLGVMLYQMLTGYVPFDDPSITSVALQHVMQPPPPPRRLNPNLSEAVEQVLARALSKDPADRYPDGAALVDALDAALRAGGEISTHDTTLPDETDKPAARAPQHEPAGARPADDLVGQMLDEYRLDELLGRGGMARVYRAHDTRLERPAAIKVIDAPFRTSPEYVKRFQREAQAIARLEHPNIVRIYRSGEAQGLLYMAMQFIEGTDLSRLLARYKAEGHFIALDAAAQIVRQVGAALDYAHQHEVVHRDIKPANIMCDQEGKVIVTDFGLALLSHRGTRGEVFGTPHYIAPEQAISSANATPLSDLYALGVILYEMVTGRVPFDAPEPLEIAMMHVQDTPTPPRELRPDIGQALNDVILKALGKEPGARYPTGAALADALDAARAAGASPEPAQAKLARPKRPLPPAPAPVQRYSTTAPGQETSALASLPSDGAAPALPRRLTGLVMIAVVGVVIGIAVIAALALGGRMTAAQPTATMTTTAAPSSTTTPTATITEMAVAPPVEPGATSTPSAAATSTPAATATGTPTPTPSPSSTFTPSPPPTTPPTATPPPTVTRVSFDLPYAIDLSETDPLAGWQYEPEAWWVMQPNGGDAFLSAAGGPENLAVVLGDIYPVWEAYKRTGLLVGMRFRLPSSSVMGRILLLDTDGTGYGIRLVDEGMTLRRLSLPEYAQNLNQGTVLGTWASVRIDRWHDLLIWIKDETIILYLDQYPGIVWTDMTLNELSRIVLQAQGNWQIDDIQVIEPEAPSEHFETLQWPDTWDAVGVADLFNKGTPPNPAARLGNVTVTLDMPPIRDVALSCQVWGGQGGFQIRMRDGQDGAFVFDFDAGQMTMRQFDADGEEVFSKQDSRYFYNYTEWHVVTIKIIGGHVWVYSDDVLYYDIERPRPPDKGLVRFVTGPSDAVWLDNCLIYKPVAP
ncbi:MAG: serine/threonine protein kinase [Anaerolineae bacterium]|nr:serine/threonine protein kinase [Anaerolineae bacterium]